MRGFTGNDIETSQGRACTDEQNDPVFCQPDIGPLETTDDRIYTTTVTPRTDQFAHNYTLTLTVPAGSVTSAAGNKPNETAWIEVRVAPPGVAVPISAIGLSAGAGDGTVRLRWNRSADDGGSPIIRYEYRYAGVGEEWSDWENVEARARGVTVENLVNGREYVFEVRAVNAMGKGPVETAMAEPVRRPRPPPPPPPPSPSTTVPDVPENLMVVGGDGEVVLSWDAPENDGGSEITHYEYRIDGRNPWISINSTQTTHTVTGLVNGTAYTFQVRAVNKIGKSRASQKTEATPEAPEVLDFAHFANGDGITSDVVLVNVASNPIRPVLYFYDPEGAPVAAASVVDVGGGLEIQEDGGLRLRTETEPLGELTIATHGRGTLLTGSVKVVSGGPVGGMVRFDLPDIGQAVVGASPATSDAIFPVRRQEGGINTGVAIHNLEASTGLVRCELLREGVLRDAVSIPLAANGQTSWMIRRGVHDGRYLGLCRVGALHRGRKWPVHGHSPGNGSRQPHLHDAAGGGGEPEPRRGDGSGLCAFRQRGVDRIRGGVRESGDGAQRSGPDPLPSGCPSEPSADLLLRSGRRSDYPRIGGGCRWRSGDHRGRRPDTPDGDGAVGENGRLRPTAGDRW